ncbi:cytochrome P450 4g15-like [Adelges cooleyi]|uniref:cytochrome P450 4g15-like n=1 Tax=Adelges cooleyi TaxID=133065 RepID=UPI0021800553|nr:cytochrome P450 4g15-like [Adelges cooleyi]
MEYLERVIKETMRLHTTVPLIARKVENEMMIGKYVVPTDAIILICIHCLHSNPKYYKDPEQFNPDVCRSRHPFAYIPFSGGSRNCVGMKYTMLQMKTTISTLKKKVELNEKAITMINGCRDEDCNYQKPKSLIEILLANEHQISHKEMEDELITIISAGHETTAKANSLIIFMLAHHQDVQQNEYQEINSIFLNGDLSRPPTYEDLQKMEYLERVIKETMRLYSAVPIVLRQVKNEMMIGKYLIPADTIIAIPIYCLHSNPQSYKDPEKFNPDNFLPDVCRSRHPYAYIPFSGGTRNCIGMKYAMLQMKTAISTLVRFYRFSPSKKCPTPQNLKLSCTISLEFINGCYVKIESRT